MDVAQDPQIAHLVASKREESAHFTTGHVASDRAHRTEHRLPMDAVEAQLSRDSVALLEKIEDVRCVVFEEVAHPSDVVRD